MSIQRKIGKCFFEETYEVREGEDPHRPSGRQEDTPKALKRLGLSIETTIVDRVWIGIHYGFDPRFLLSTDTREWDEEKREYEHCLEKVLKLEKNYFEVSPELKSYEQFSDGYLRSSSPQDPNEMDFKKARKIYGEGDIVNSFKENLLWYNLGIKSRNLWGFDLRRPLIPGRDI
jgi:hypothetical protein